MIVPTPIRAEVTMRPHHALPSRPVLFLVAIAAAILGTLSLTRRSAWADSVTVFVNAATPPPGVDTGLSIVSGESITISANGSGTYGRDTSTTCPGFPSTTPDGSRSTNGRPCAPYNYSASADSTAPIGALVGRIGTGPWFLVGSSYHTISSASGELILLYNDANTWSDNTGGFSVTISYVPLASQPPPPSGGGSSNPCSDRGITAQSGGPFSGVANQQLTFVGTASTTNQVNGQSAIITEYRWSFGDNTTASGQIVSHTYASVGTYTVLLVASDSAGCKGTSTTTATITAVQAPPPVVQMNQPACSPDGTSITWSWAAMPGATAYFLQVGTRGDQNADGSLVQADVLNSGFSISSTSSQTAATPGVSYYAVVNWTGPSKTGQGSASNEVSIACAPPPPPTIANPAPPCPARELILLNGINTTSNDQHFFDYILRTVWSVYDKKIFFSYKQNSAQYSQQDTFQSLPASALTLQSLIRQERAGCPDTKFDLIGHSLGGVVILDYLFTTLQPSGRDDGAHILHAITLDSPVNGRSSHDLATFANLIPVPPLRDYLMSILSSEPAQELDLRHADPGTATTNASLVQHLQDRTTFYTIASDDDLVVPPVDALIPGADIDAGQLGGGTYVIDPSCLPGPVYDMLLCVGHTEVLQDPQVLSTIRAIVTDQYTTGSATTSATAVASPTAATGSSTSGASPVLASGSVSGSVGSTSIDFGTNGGLVQLALQATDLPGYSPAPAGTWVPGTWSAFDTRPVVAGYQAGWLSDSTTLGEALMTWETPTKASTEFASNAYFTANFPGYDAFNVQDVPSLGIGDESRERSWNTVAADGSMLDFITITMRRGATNYWVAVSSPTGTGGYQVAMQYAQQLDAKVTAGQQASVNPNTPRAPYRPTYPALLSVDATTLRLEWQDNSDNETGFVIYDGLTGKEVGRVGANVTTYTWTGLQRNTRYCAYVYAFNSAGFSPPSNVMVCNWTAG